MYFQALSTTAITSIIWDTLLGHFRDQFLNLFPYTTSFSTCLYLAVPGSTWLYLAVPWSAIIYLMDVCLKKTSVFL